MLTYIRTLDGRLLVTDRNRIGDVLREADEDGVRFNHLNETPEEAIREILEEEMYDVSERNYILVNIKYDVEEACRPAKKGE